MPPSDSGVQSVVECHNLRKRYGSTVALDGVDLACLPGAVHALVGQNGAGKSTVVKILAGVEQPDSGMVQLRNKGSLRGIASPLQAEALGISVVHQDHALVPGLSVGENMLLGIEPRTRWGRLERTEMREVADRALSEIGATISPGAYVEDLRVGEREQVAIAAALLREPSLLILDEPTASLGRDEISTLFDVIERLKQRGTALLFVSHFLDDVKAISDQVTVLRNGRVVMHSPTEEATVESISVHMVGEEHSTVATPAREAPPARVAEPTSGLVAQTPRLVVTGLDVGVASGVNLAVGAGECVAIVGVSGSGAEEVGRAVAGLERMRGGELVVSGQRVRRWSRAWARRAGIGFVPSDRRVDGLFADESISTNVIGGELKAVSKFGVLSGGLVRRRVAAVIRRLAVKCRSTRQPVRQLSGGNQQKVLVGRWLDRRFSLLVLIGPTTGVDVGARADIYRAIEEYKSEGGSVVLVSSDLDEVLRLARKVTVMVRGKALQPLASKSLSQATLLELMLGGRLSELAGGKDG